MIDCYRITFNLNKSVGSRLLAQALDSTALQKNTRLTEWVKLRFFQSTVKPTSCAIIPLPTDFFRFNEYLYSRRIKYTGNIR